VSPTVRLVAKAGGSLGGIGVMLRPAHQVSKAAAVMGRERW
jgi:hypothetical protein